MRLKEPAIFLVILLSLTLTFNLTPYSSAQSTDASNDLYFGVDVGFENLTDTLRIVDETSLYTNLFIIGCYGPVIHRNFTTIYNESRLDLISEHVYAKGLNFIVYSDDPSYPSATWLQSAGERFGGKFLGVYYFDEAGGKQLDQANYPAFYYAENFSDAASRYVNTVNWWLRGPHSINRSLDGTGAKLFTSDYGLYWFDYQAGYDTVFAEYGWNSGWKDYSRQLNAALVRGAATALNKDWGIMITWAYQQPPYMESGPDLYKDMVSAYENGAKYILIFDSNKDWTQNVLGQEHFDAMKQFWQYVQAHPRTPMPPSERTLYVLPPDYATGFRVPDDRIWGLWTTEFNVNGGSQNFSAAIGGQIAALLQTYGPKLDIAYPTSKESVESIGYEAVLYWNDTALVPNVGAVPPQSPAGDPSAWQLITPKPSATPISANFNLIGLYGAAVVILVFVAVFVVAAWVKRKSRLPPR